MASQPANREENKLVTFNNQLSKGADQFKMVLPAHIKPDQFQRTILTAVQNDPALLDADRQSLLLACMKCAQDGLLPDKREAAFVIFSNRVNQGGTWVSVKFVQYMPMVYGLRKKILQSGAIKDIAAKVVYRCEVESGAFIYEEGSEAALRHRPMLEMTEEQSADDKIVAAYSMATFMDGTKSYEVMRRFEINKVRQVSQTGALGKTKYNSAEVIPPKGPWVDWFAEQAKKTVMRRHAKTLPMSGDLLDVEGRDDDLAARSTERVLSAPETPALASVPTRSELTHLDDGMAVDLTPHDADGVVAEEGAKPTKSAKPKAEKHAAPQPADDDENGQTSEDGEESIYNRLSERIARADSVIAVARIVAQIPDTMRDSWQSSLREQATAKDGELREPRA